MKFNEYKEISEAKWGIEVTGSRGNKMVSKGTSNNRGPWNSKVEAERHISDLADDMEYNDEYKYATFKAVPIK